MNRFHLAAVFVMLACAMRVACAFDGTARIMSPRGLTGQFVSVSTTSVQSTAIPGSEQFVDIDCDAPAFFEIGENPTAVVNTRKRIPADQTHRYWIITGDKIAFIVASGTATCWIHPVR